MAFQTKPNLDVKVTRAIVSLPAQQFVDSLTNPNPTQTYPKDTWFQLPNEYNGVQTGQQWTFIFYGTVAANNTAYVASSNYTIP